ncbi:MAG: efflux RND transporter permease subunit [Muribaculaceae bacterium]|nr:efflux RND transporter permease subunit [Muribaculaceae bacterium]
MLNRIIRMSLRNRAIVLIATGIILCAGVMTALRSEIDVFPDLNAPTVVVMSEAPGYSTDEIEKTVLFPIETAVNGATGVRRVRSSASNGFGVVWVEFDWNTDIYLARQIVSEKLGTLDDELPQNIKRPVLGPQSSILGEVLIIGLTSDSISLMQLRSFADQSLRRMLLSVPGVSQVSVMGGDVKQYHVQINTEKMKHFNVSIGEVIAAIESMNNNVGGSSIYEYGNEYIIKGNIRTSDMNQLGLCVIRSDENGVVTLNDIGEIVAGMKTPLLGVASVDDTPAVLLTITKQPNVDTNRLTKKIEACINSIEGNMGNIIQFHTDIFRQSDFINNSISNIQHSLIEGAIFVIVVLFFFLMNVRTTVISLVVLPLSVLVTLLILHFCGYSLNTMSLGGIAIAMGALVDDAIVDVENVYKRLRQNKGLPEKERLSSIDVVFRASAEVRMPIFNSSLIIMASFLPLFFLTGIEGRLLIPLGVSFIVALIASTVVALTVTPVMCSYLLKENDNSVTEEPKLIVALKKTYTNVLERVLTRPITILGVIIALFVVACVGFLTLGRSFLPSFNEGSFTINVATLPGVSLDVSNEIGKRAEEAIMSIPEIKKVARKTGRAELDEHSRGVNASEFEAPYVLSGRSRSKIMEELRDKLTDIPGTNIEIGQPISHRIDAMLSGTESQIAVKIFGDDLITLYNLGTQIQSVMQNVPGVIDINVEQQVMRPELKITPKRELMARYGVTMSDFREFLEVAFAGKEVSHAYDDGFPVPIVVQIANSETSRIEDIKNLSIDSSYGKIPLHNIADIRTDLGPNSINRENVSRRIVVSANVSDGNLVGTVNAIKNAIAENVKLPDGYNIAYGGQFESEETASKTLMWMSLLSLLIVFVLLYQEFKSVRESLVILVNLPLAMCGGVIILLLTGSELNIPAIIGFISLLGITTRNGMLLISRYNHLKEEAPEMTKRMRIISGSADRLSPILMTALTTALALIPLVIKAGAPGNEIQSPMAIVILGGLVTSTVLNVFVVPVLYSFINKNKE